MSSCKVTNANLDDRDLDRQGRANACLIAAAPDLARVLAEALPVLEEWADLQRGYGAFPGGDPRHFMPDAEGTTDAEREAWREACEAAQADESARALPGGHRIVTKERAEEMLAKGEIESATFGPAGFAHVTRVMFGLGTYRNPKADALVESARAALLYAGVTL